MRKLLILPFLLFISLMTGNAQEAKVLPAGAFRQKLSATPDGQLLDVRTKEEFSDKRLENALNADYNNPDEFKERVRFLDKDRPVFVYCLAGGRSAKAAEYLRGQGFREVYDMKGGIRSWVAGNNPVAAGSNRTKKAGMTVAAYEKEIAKHPSKLVLADFGAKWCPPCKKMAPEMERLSKDMTNILVVLPLDVDEHQTLSQAKKVTVLPTLILYKNGKVVWQHEGYASREQIMSQVEKHR